MAKNLFVVLSWCQVELLKNLFSQLAQSKVLAIVSPGGPESGTKSKKGDFERLLQLVPQPGATRGTSFRRPWCSERQEII